MAKALNGLSTTGLPFRLRVTGEGKAEYGVNISGPALMARDGNTLGR